MIVQGRAASQIGVRTSKNGKEHMVLGLLKKKTAKPNPYPLYQSIVDQARQVAFYRDLDVDDSLDGRFDMITLHAVLTFHALSKRETEAVKLSQATFDLMFKDMDRSLRERGVGDTSVPKKVKKMGEVFFGRSDAYRAALSKQDLAALKEALYRNVYASEGDVANAAQLADYVVAADAQLTQTPLETFQEGTICWPNILPDPRS